MHNMKTLLSLLTILNTARIRTKLPADETLFKVLDRCINDCLNNSIIPVLAYNALDYELNPNELLI